MSFDKRSSNKSRGSSEANENARRLTTFVTKNIEPISPVEFFHAFLTNSYVEILTTAITIAAIFAPNYFSLFITASVQIFLIGVPSRLLRNEPRTRLQYFIYASIILGLFVIGVICLKVFLLNMDFSADDRSFESYGIYRGQESIELQLVVSLSFEVPCLFLLFIIQIVTRVIYKEVLRAQKLKVPWRTFYDCNSFADMRKIFKYLFVALSACEVMLQPDLLALIILFLFFLLLIFALVYTTSNRNRATMADKELESDHFRAVSMIESTGIVGWAMKDERLFKIMMEWQKFFMMLQLFEYLFFHTYQVQQELFKSLTGESQLSQFFNIVAIIGNGEYQQADTIEATIERLVFMILTSLIIFFAQMTKKSYHHYNSAGYQDNQDAANESGERKANSFGLKIAKFLSRDQSITMIQYKTTILGFLPVLLCWLFRFTTAIWAYMYNSKVAFFHLIWVLASFFLPTAIFYNISVFIFLPLCCIEFSIFYVSCIPSFQNGEIFNLWLFQEYNFKPRRPFLELSLMFSILILMGLMIPARLRFKAYDQHHNGSDMKKDLIVRKIKSSESSILWKIFFVFIINMHTLVIFLMLFAGSQDFNLFQLGFMFFFVGYSASEYLYQKTSFLLPIFISFFISAQYYWSIWHKEGYDKRDFLYMVDGWIPPADPNNFYWARPPNLKLWALLILMNTLHEVTKLFPDQKQNEKYIKECDKHISENYPRLTKWFKRTRNILFMLLLVVLFFMMARDLIRQKPNLVNLIYLILFTVTFGKMCITSIDGNSTKACLQLANIIKRYSAITLSLTVIYHMLRFEFFELDDWFDQQQTQGSFLVQNMKFLGVPETQTDTTNSVQLYTAYMIVGQILHKYFSEKLQSQEGRDLFNWSEAFKSRKGVNKALEFTRFDQAHLVYNMFDLWPFLDLFCTYFHFLTNGVIVYYSITVAISFFYAVHLSMIVLFYCYSTYRLHKETSQSYEDKQQSDPITIDLQMASDASRKYKKKSHDIFLNIRKNLWIYQYSFTLIFVFASYLNPMISEMVQTSTGSQLELLQTVQFYLFWLGVSYPEVQIRKVEGLMPVHIMISFLLCEKQAQNWLYSRWGLNKSLISKFTHLEFLLNLEKKGKQLLLGQKQLEEQPNFIEIFKYNFQEQMPKPHAQGEEWRVEDLNNCITITWQNVKIRRLIKKALYLGIKEILTQNQLRRTAPINRQPSFLRKTTIRSVQAQLFDDEHADTMTLPELQMFDQELKEIFHIDFKLTEKFVKQAQKSEDREYVLYNPIKLIIEKQLKSLYLINFDEIPFLSFSQVSSLRNQIFTQLDGKFLDTMKQYTHQKNIDISERIKEERKSVRLDQLRKELQKLVGRRYSNSMWSGARLIYEQLSLILLLTSVVIKCNIVSLIYLVLVSIYLRSDKKQQAMHNQVYIISAIFIAQYWLYLSNLTSSSSPSKLPESPYPSEADPQGKYLIPIFYKFAWARNINNAYFFSLGLEIQTVETLSVDFWNLVLVAMYMFYYCNPVLQKNIKNFVWESKKEYSSQNKTQEEIFQVNSGNQINFNKKLEEYTELMNYKYPAEFNHRSKSKRLSELKDQCSFYIITKNAPILIFTTWHIFTMFVILLMALCRRSLISLGYVVALLPYLRDSRSVLKQHENYVKQQKELNDLLKNPEFLQLSPEMQIEHQKEIKRRHSWSFVNLLCKYLIIYSYLDFTSQVIFQVPYLPNIPALDLLGLRKNYPTRDNSLDYLTFISGKAQVNLINRSNMMMFLLNCVILCAISTQNEIFRSVAYCDFVQKNGKGLDLLMKMATLKKYAITYAYNNAKMEKILAIQKTQQQILGTVERIKVNVNTFRKFQQRQMLQEYVNFYENDLQIPQRRKPDKDLKNKKEEISQEEILRKIETIKPENLMKTLCKAIREEREKREKLITEKATLIIETVLPFRASIYLRLMSFSTSFLFVQRQKEMKIILKDMETGRYNPGIDLVKHIRSDLYAILSKLKDEMSKQQQIEESQMSPEELQDKRQQQQSKEFEWPEIKLSDLRQTNEFCEWTNIVPEWFAAIFRAIISNTQTLAYISMISSIFTNAGIVAIFYPFAVFGMALLEETRPGKLFWRIMLSYTLGVLLLKFITNLSFMEILLQNEWFVFVDGYLKLGLHHMNKTKALVIHMLPEMLIIACILCHEIVEQLTGLYRTNETEVESVSQAIRRIFTKGEIQKEIELDSNKNVELEVGGDLEENVPKQFTQNDNKTDSNSFKSYEQADNESVLKLDNFEDQDDFEQSHREKKIKYQIWDHKYFQRLFPKVQQQKPGTDYYGWLTWTQMILCWYLLNKFNLFSATGPYQEQNIFQNEMVIVLFFQIGVMILERYIARTEHRVQIERYTKTDQILKPTIKDNQLFQEKLSDDDLTVRLVIQKLKFQDLRDKQHMETLFLLRQQQEADIIQTETKITIQQKCKYILHWVNLVLVHVYIFYYVPLSTNEVLYGTSFCTEKSAYGCKEFRFNDKLQNFYILYCLYFYFSAKQIADGLPSLRRGSSIYLLEGGHYLYDDEWANICAQAFCWLPLTMEIRCLVDFCFSETALDMWQIMQLFQYHYDFYIAKTAHMGHNLKEVGAKREGFPDLICWGHACLVGIMIMMLGPFFWLSGFYSSHIGYNPVLKSDVQVWLQFNETQLFQNDYMNDNIIRMGEQTQTLKIYQNESPIIFQLNEEIFKESQYDKISETMFFNYSQVQYVIPKFFSDTNWIISDDLRLALQKYACVANIQNQNSSIPPGCETFQNITTISNVQIGFQLRVSFERAEPSSAQIATGMQQRNLDPSNPSDRDLLSQFSEIMAQNCSADNPPIYTLNITEFYTSNLLLGETPDAVPIHFQSKEIDKEPKHNMLLTYKCKDQWAIGTGKKGEEKAMEFIMFNQRVQVGWLQGYSIMAFYTGIILTLGMYLRPIFIFTTNRAFIYEINYPDPMIRLVESIHLAKARGDLVTEEFNFRMLQDILRSPELLHILTGNNMKSVSVAPTDKEQHSHLIPKAFY